MVRNSEKKSSGEKQNHELKLKGETKSDRRQLINIEEAELCLASLELKIILFFFFCVCMTNHFLGDQIQNRCEDEQM